MVQKTNRTQLYLITRVYKQQKSIYVIGNAYECTVRSKTITKNVNLLQKVRTLNQEHQPQIETTTSNHE